MEQTRRMRRREFLRAFGLVAGATPLLPAAAVAAIRKPEQQPKVQQGIVGSWYCQAPRGVLDGRNTRFTLDHGPDDFLGSLVLNGLVQRPGFDYKVHGKLLVYMHPPSAHDWHSFTYVIA